jgi:phosphate transport system permease protein
MAPSFDIATRNINTMNDDVLSAKKRRNDTLARYFITFVGIGTILSVLAILVVIIIEIIPLFESSEAVKVANINNDRELIGVGVDSYNEKSYSISKNGRLIEVDLKTGSTVQEIPLVADQQRVIVSAEQGLDGATTLTFDDGRVQRETLQFRPEYDKNGDRTIVLKRAAPVIPPLKKNITFALSRKNEAGRVTFAQLDQQGVVHVTHLIREENFLGEVEEKIEECMLRMESPIVFLAASPNGHRMYTYGLDGKLEYWNTRNSQALSEGITILSRKGRTLKAMVSMIGGDEVVLGYDNGKLEVYALTMGSTGMKSPLKIHEAQIGQGGIEKIIPSPRNRTLFIADASGALTAWYSTSERVLSKMDFGFGEIIMGISNRGLGLITAHNGQLQAWSWESEHPEAGFQALFGKVWYSSYPEPSFSWQSSSGSDDFEPKLSLIPLIFGSLKGSIYAMLFSVPFAVFAALYTSVFATPKVKAIIKPTVEMMAAIPSVVIGFLAALWLAPLIDGNLLTVAFSLPISFCLLALMPVAFGQVKGKDLMVLRPGLILFVSMILILLSLGMSKIIGTQVEIIWFEGDFRGWLNREIPYDIRNSIIIGIALGFTVIPIIYTISEDALSSVPKGLTSASLALGATPWQTAWRIVLPAASPGIFAAITLGLGRAVGETMIVLMATGNTAIMKMNIFEGFRALSANIAVEIPEAPHGGTLYRVLFLSAGVLLVFTSILNTITEYIRQRLAKTYSRF